MNVQRGLQRINAAFWSLFGAVWAFLAVADLAQGNFRGEIALGGLALVAGSYAAYRVCRWIIAGFFDNA